MIVIGSSVHKLKGNTVTTSTLITPQVTCPAGHLFIAVELTEMERRCERNSRRGPYSLIHISIDECPICIDFNNALQAAVHDPDMELSDSDEMQLSPIGDQLIAIELVSA